MIRKIAGHLLQLGPEKRKLTHTQFTDLIAFIEMYWHSFDLKILDNGKNYTLFFDISKCDFKGYVMDVAILLNAKYQIKSLYFQEYYASTGYYYSIPKSKVEEMTPMFKSIFPKLLLYNL